MKFRKALVAISATLTVALAAFGLTACGESGSTSHNHTYGEWTITQEATCTESGKKEQVCSVCGDKQTEIIPAGHTYGEWVVTKEYTCDENGSREKVCSACGDKQSEIIYAHHTENAEGVITKAATCTSNGMKTFYCQVCGEVTRTETILATGHHYDDGIVTEEPGCTTTGVKTYTCSSCGDVNTEVILATGHRYDNGTITIPATCTEGGVIKYKCLICNNIKTDVISAKGHSYGEGTVTLSPTCSNPGTMTYTCSECSDTKTEAIPATEQHMDDNHDGYCDTCNMFLEEVKQIKTVEDLKLIINDLSASYSLQNDLSLSDNWTGIGTSDYPFTGKFYGNGYTISGLKFTATPNPGGLFIVNQGLIDGLTLSNMSLDMYVSNYTASATFTYAGIAAYNYGTIQNCKITGTNQIVGSNRWNLSSKYTTNFTFRAGGITAVNYGKIDGCSVEGIMNNQFYSKCRVYRSGMIVTSDDWAKVTSTVYYGNIAGVNKGTITNSTFTGTHEAELNSIAEVDSYGQSTSIMNSKIGSLVGLNESIIKDCSAKATLFVQNRSQDTTGSNQVRTAQINIANVERFSGLLAENSGTIDNLLLIL